MNQTEPPARSGWTALRERYPKAVLGGVSLMAVLLAANALLVARWLRYSGETERLRAGMTDAERDRTDFVLASEQNRFAVMMELVRRQAAADREMHLSVSLDSGTALFERDRAVLRRMAVEVGGEHLIGVPPDTVRVVPPRGVRSVSKVLGPREAWEVPEWVYTARGVVPPADRKVRGALGRDAVLLTGGTVVYALPDSGILADSSFVLPGAVRLSRADLRAIAPNISPGMSVYFYE